MPAAADISTMAVTPSARMLELAAHTDGQSLDSALTAVCQGPHLNHRILVYAQNAFPDGVARLQRAETSLERINGNDRFHIAVSFHFRFRFPLR